MSNDLRSLIDDIANRADDFLSGVKSRQEARAGIEELLTTDFPDLAGKDRTAVINGVMAILEDEDFFGIEFVGDSPADSDEAPDRE